jgi:rfaE bifunctional protein nucleotidyltransferase chain/domain
VSARIVLDYHDLGPRLEDERSDRRTVAVANGCFDLIHVGHVRLLADARTEADVLVVALNTDDSVRESKGDGRPLVPLAERMEVVAAIAGVDYVTSFPEPTAGPLLETLRPDVQIKGMDRDVGSVPERSIVERYGGRVVFCGDEKTHSSSDLAQRLRGG